MKKFFLLGASVLLLSTLSCNKEGAEPLSDNITPEISAEQSVGTPLEEIALGAEVDTDIEEIAFDSQAEDEARNLKFGLGTIAGKVGAKLKVIEDKPLYSLCVIAPKGANTPVHYLKLTWKKKQGANYFSVSERDVRNLDGQKISLDKTKSWRICGLLTYQESDIITNNKTVRHQPNEQVGTPVSTNDAEVALNKVPLYFDWTDLTLKGDNVEAFNANRTNPAKIKIKPMGAMVRISITNKAAFTMKVNSLKISSNGFLADAGYSGFDSGVTPFNVPLSQNYRGAAGDKFEKTISLSGVTLTAGQTHPKSFLLWVLPKDLRTDQTKAKYTKVMASAVRIDGGSEKEFPRMNHLYGFWSTENNLQHGKRHHLAVTLYRPKQPLEYLSEGYLKQDRTGFAPGSPAAILYPTVTEFYSNSFRMPSGYRRAAGVDVRAMMTVAPKVKFKNDGHVETVNNVPGHIRIGSKLTTSNMIGVFRNGTPTVYALRFDDGVGEGKRLYYAAYRYTESNPNSYESFYLGPNFKGTFADVKADLFNEHRKDLIVRQFANYTSIVRNRENLKTNGLMSFVEKIRGNEPWVIWFADRVDANSDKRMSEASFYQPRKKKLGAATGSEDNRTVPVVLIQTHDNFPNDNKR